MAYTTVTQLFQAIANAIRTKDNTSAAIDVQDYADRILAIPAGGECPEILDAAYMFYQGTRLSQLSAILSLFGAVTSIERIFYQASSVANIDLSAMNWSNLVNANEAFYYCSNLSAITLPQTPVSNIKVISNMFIGTKLSTINLNFLENCQINNADGAFRLNTFLSEFDFSKLKLSTTFSAVSIASMLSGCSNLLILLNVGSFNVSKVINTSSMLSGCSKVPSLDVTDWDLISLTGNVSNMLANMTSCTSYRGLSFPALASSPTQLFGTAVNNVCTEILFKNGGVFGSQTSAAAMTLDLSYMRAFTATSYENMINSLAANTSPGIRTIKLFSTLYNSLTPSQISLASAKNYTLSF